MAFSGQWLNLWDLGQRMKGTMLGAIVESLTQRNAMLRGMVFEEADRAAEHEWHIRTSYPSGTWINAYQGQLPEKTGVTRQVERPGVLVMRSRVDDEILRQAGDNRNQLRFDEDKGFIDSMGQQGVGTALYGSSKEEPRQFDGLATKLHSTAQRNVWDGGAPSGKMTSLYVVVWNREYGCTMFYPPGSTAGIFMQDLGMSTIVDPNDTTEYEVWRTKFRLAWGMAIKDHRCCARYANIAVPADTATGAAVYAEAFNPDIMIAIRNFLWTKEGARIYLNRDAQTQVDQDALNKPNAYYNTANIYGEDVMAFRGIPFELEEQILSYETRVTATT